MVVERAPVKMICHASAGRWAKSSLRFGAIINRLRRRLDWWAVPEGNIPVATPKNPYENFQRAILNLEKKRKSRIYSIVHAGEREHLCVSTFWSVVNRRRQFDKIDTLEILLHSPGGHAELAYQLVKFFRNNCKRLNIIVPLAAKSAATLMCLGADAVYMGRFAELGPLDIQIEDPIEKGSNPVSPIDDFKSMEFLREYAVEILDYFTLTFVKMYGLSLKDALPHSTSCVAGLVGKLYEQIDPLEVGGHRRSLAIGEEYANRLLKITKNPNLKAIVKKLVWEYPSHDFAVDYDEALELGLPVQRLEKSQDDILIDGLREVMRHDIPYYGFVQQPQSKPKKATAKRPTSKASAKRKPVQVARPAVAPVRATA